MGKAMGRALGPWQTSTGLPQEILVRVRVPHVKYHLIILAQKVLVRKLVELVQA